MSRGGMARTISTVGYFEPKRRDPVREPPALFLAETAVEVGGRPSFLSRLSGEEYRKVRSVGRAFRVAAGESVFCQGDAHDGIFLIEDGSVRTFYTGPTGREITLAYWTPGHFVGGPEIFGGGSHVWSGVAVQASHLLYLRGGDLRQLMEQMPGLAFGIVEGLVQKGKCYSALVQMLGTRSVVERLAQLLIILAESGDAADGEAVVIDRALTHEELANMVGSTRQWVTATIRKFQQKGLLSVEGRRLVLRDLFGLRQIAGIC